MTSHTRPSRVAEWAELVGDSIPDVVCDDGEESPSERDAADAHARWSDGRASSARR